MADSQHREQNLGEARDWRVVTRLLAYLKPYKWSVIAALVLTILNSADQLKANGHPKWKNSIIQTYFLYRGYEPTNQAIQSFNFLDSRGYKNNQEVNARMRFCSDLAMGSMLALDRTYGKADVEKGRRSASHPR